MPMMSTSQAQTLLPKVGDVRREIPTVGKITRGPEDTTNTAQPCIVVEVNAAHLWYRVRFLGSGFYECYKVPRVKRAYLGGLC